MDNSREAYLSEMKERLKDCSKRIDKLTALARNAKPPKKLRLYDQLEDLVIIERSARVDLNSLAEASDGEWQHKHRVFEKTMHSLQDALHSVPLH